MICLGLFLIWSNSATNGTIEIYSTTNVTFSTQQKQEALTKVVRLVGQPNVPTNFTANITDLIPIDPTNLPPVNTWSRYAEVPASRSWWEVTSPETRRFFAITYRDERGAESDFNR